MRRYSLTLLIFLLTISFASAKDDNWLTTKSTHFIVYYKNAPEDFLDQLIEKAEDYYDKIADDLGFRRRNFWTWSNRAKIYIYDDASDYQSATGKPAWSSGYAIPELKIIHTFPYAANFFDTILPHELGHIIFREFIGNDNRGIPIWLDEGVASYQENLKYRRAASLVKEAIKANKFIDLEELSSLNPQKIEDNEVVNLFYAESISIIDYLIKEFGKDDFIFFCQNLRDKRDLKKAIAYVYPFRDLEELNYAWEKYLKK
jgi:hypothetical protein